jgi:hypothetical protein
MFGINFIFFYFLFFNIFNTFGAGQLSELIGKEHVKLRIYPVKLRQLIYSIVTVISDEIILF